MAGLFGGRSDTFTDGGMATFLESVPKLEHVDLMGSRFADKTFDGLARCCGHLISFNLKMNDNMNDVALMNLARNCPNLEVVEKYLPLPSWATLASRRSGIATT